ncbi:MAG: hypothetical protein ACTXOO_05090 [Sodalis sp. (in: enterobacteria)]
MGRVRPDDNRKRPSWLSVVAIKRDAGGLCLGIARSPGGCGTHIPGRFIFVTPNPAC